MNQYIEGTIVICISLLAIRFRAEIARDAIRHQNRLFGFHFTEEDLQSSDLVGIAIGIFGIVLGLLRMAGIINH